MALTFGQVSFPGVDFPRKCRYTRSLGTRPDVAILEMLPQVNTIAGGGTLAMQFDPTLAVAFPGCKVDFGSIRVDKNGFVVSVRIFDRRWHWKFSYVHGSYNERFPDGDLDTSTEKTPQELAGICFDAIGEVGYDVSALPNFDRPQKNWVYANAARELDLLCEERGCRVSLGLDNIARIVRLGAGVGLPPSLNTEIRTESYSVNPPERPDEILLVGAPILFETFLLLEAVGLDTDGSVKLIDDLSYKPSTGWSDEPENDFADVSVVSGEEAVFRAKETVWRWYRVKSLPDGTLDVPGYSGTVTEISQLFPLRSYRLTTYQDVDGNDRPAPADVFGVYWIEGEDEISPEKNSDPIQPVPVPFTLDRYRGIVKFSRPVFQRDGAAKNRKEADLYLRTSYSVRNADDRQLERYTRGRALLPITGTGTHVIRREDVLNRVLTTYDTSANPPTVISTVTNDSQVDSEADNQLDAAELEFQAVESRLIEYRGILPFSVDGLNRQVTWEVDLRRGHRTWVSQNSEQEVFVLRHPERRRIEEQEEETREDGVGRVQGKSQEITGL